MAKKKTAAKKKVAAKGKTKSKANGRDLATTNEQLPAYMKQDSTRGQENIGLDDLTIPRLDVIQDLSPQHKKNKPEYIDGAKVGMLFNTVTGTLYGDKVYFVPVYFRKEWVIWKDRDSGGGFAGAYSSKTEAEGVLATLENPEQHEIVDTAQQFGVIINDDDTHEDIVISMAKSKMKTSRQLNTMAKIAGGDRFSRVYKVSASELQNSKGQDYYGMAVSQLGFAPEGVYNHAEAMYESIASGQRDVNRDVADVAE